MSGYAYLLGLLLWLGIVGYVGYRMYKEKTYATLSAGPILFATAFFSFLFASVTLSGLAWLVRMLGIGLGSALEVMAGAIVVLLAFGTLPLLEHFWAEKVLHVRHSGGARTTSFLDLGPDLGVTLSRQVIEEIERIELQASDGGYFVRIVFHGKGALRSMKSLPQEEAEELRKRLQMDMETFLAGGH